MVKILSGKEVSKNIKNNLKKDIALLAEKKAEGEKKFEESLKEEDWGHQPS